VYVNVTFIGAWPDVLLALKFGLGKEVASAVEGSTIVRIRHRAIMCFIFNRSPILIRIYTFDVKNYEQIYPEHNT